MRSNEPIKVPVTITVGTIKSIVQVICGEIMNSETPQPIICKNKKSLGQYSFNEYHNKYESEEPRTDLHTCVKLRNPWEIHSLNALLKSWTSEVSLRIKSYIFIYKEIYLNFHFMYSNTLTPKMHLWNQEHHASA